MDSYCAVAVANIVVVGTAEYRGSYFYGGKNGKDKSAQLNGNHDN